MQSVAQHKRSRKNLSRDEFLDLALEALGHTGRSRLHLDSMMAAMPVTKGSFYHHFKNKYEFLKALVQHWDDTQTQSVIDAVNESPPETPPQERLWLLMWYIERHNLNKYERCLRSLALEDEVLGGMLSMVDHKRLRTLKGLFSEMGFSDLEADVRARAFVTTMSQESFIGEPVPETERELHLRARHAFFIRP